MLPAFKNTECSWRFMFFLYTSFMKVFQCSSSCMNKFSFHADQFLNVCGAFSFPELAISSAHMLYYLLQINKGFLLKKDLSKHLLVTSCIS